jgi:hypothetical protein
MAASTSSAKVSGMVGSVAGLAVATAEALVVAAEWAVECVAAVAIEWRLVVARFAKR